MLKEEVKQLRNETKETSRSALDIELEPETRDRKASRNSCAEIYHNNTVRRKSLKLLGEDVVMDEWLDWRVKWGQCGNALCALIAIPAFAFGGTVAGFITVTFAVIAIMFWVLFMYKNVSFVMIKRLMKELNVVTIVIFTIFNAIIDIGVPAG